MPARIRLGPVGPRDIEAILADRGAADPPTAARLGRMAGGRPGLALAYAHAPDALRLRGELGRVLLDMLDATPGDRLAAMRAAMPQALALAADLERGAAAPLRRRRRCRRWDGRERAPRSIEGNGSGRGPRFEGDIGGSGRDRRP